MPSYNYMAENGLPFAKVFGERIRQRRKEMGFSQGDLFEKTSISTAYISSVDIMVQLCVALECSIADMLRPEGID
jgi:predicted transcriptional regulator